VKTRHDNHGQLMGFPRSRHGAERSTADGPKRRSHVPSPTVLGAARRSQSFSSSSDSRQRYVLNLNIAKRQLLSVPLEHPLRIIATSVPPNEKYPMGLWTRHLNSRLAVLTAHQALSGQPGD